MAWEVPAESNRDKLPRLQRQDALGLFAPHKLHIPSKERGACGYHATGPRLSRSATNTVSCPEPAEELFHLS